MQPRKHVNNAAKQAAYRARRGSNLLVMPRPKAIVTTVTGSYTINLTEDELGFLACLTTIYQEWIMAKHRPATTTQNVGGLPEVCRWKWALNEVGDRVGWLDEFGDMPYLFERLGILRSAGGGFVML